MREEKLELLQNGILHISKIWEANGHKKWTWVLPRTGKTILAPHAMSQNFVQENVFWNRYPDD